MDRTRLAGVIYRSGSLLAVLPAAVVLGVLLTGGLSLSLVQVFRSPEGASRVLIEIFTTAGFWSSLGLTIWVATLSTVLTVAGALVTAFALRRVARGRSFLRYIYQLPLTVPHMVVAAAGLTLLTQSGLLSRLITSMGLITDPSGFPELVFDRLGIGIILVYVWKQIPFVGLIVLSVLQSLGADYEAVARTHGATRSQALRHVLIPLILPGLVPASIVLFAFSFGAFEVPLMLGARYPSMLSVLVYRLYTDTDLSLRPQAMALSLTIAVMVLLLTTLYRRVARRSG